MRQSDMSNVVPRWLDADRRRIADWLVAVFGASPMA
jgi:hypothetical protein